VTGGSGAATGKGSAELACGGALADAESAATGAAMDGNAGAARAAAGSGSDASGCGIDADATGTATGALAETGAEPCCDAPPLGSGGDAPRNASAMTTPTAAPDKMATPPKRISPAPRRSW